jgi:hypothetical protein
MKYKIKSTNNPDMVIKGLIPSLFIIIIGLLFSCNSSIDQKVNDESYLKEYELFVNSITTFQYKAEERVHWERDSICIDSWMLNINKYIGLFNKLKIEKGYSPYLTYMWFGSSGYPEIMFIKDSLPLDSIIRSFIYKDSIGFTVSDQSYNFYNNVHWSFSDTIRDKYQPKKHLEVEDSKMGYFQLLCFYLISTDFAKYWHANYSQMEILTSTARLDTVLNRYEQYIEEKEMSDFRSQKQKALDIDSLITINFTPDSCLLKITVAQRSIMDDNGIYRLSWSISRKFPHVISMSSYEKVVNDPIMIMY